MDNGIVFERIEKKYLMTKKQYTEFVKRMAPYMRLDEYGRKTVSSVYYDTDDFLLIARSIEKPVYKEKLRIRSYGTPGPDDPVYIELKKKYRGIVYKRRKEMPLREARAYLAGEYRPEEDQILREIDYFLDYYRPKPKILIMYERSAYYSRMGPKIRLTIDENIRARYDDLHLGKSTEGEMLFDTERYLMELKIEGAVPLWLSKAMTELGIRPESFSKYGRLYQKKMKEEREKHV